MVFSELARVEMAQSLILAGPSMGIVQASKGG